MMTDPGALSSAFPAPPRDYELFTDANIALFNSNPDDDGLPPIIADAMRPPEFPTTTYSIFGKQLNTNNDDQNDEFEPPTLQASGIKQLVASAESANRLPNELKKMARSILLNFLELVVIMSTCPEQFPEKVNHIRIILMNCHHLINCHRPAQTRVTLLELMQQRLNCRLSEVEALEDLVRRTQDAVVRYQGIHSEDTEAAFEGGVHGGGEITGEEVIESEGNGEKKEEDDGEESARWRDAKLFEILNAM